MSAVARVGSPYPQAVVPAEALADRRVLACPPRTSIERARVLLARARAQVLLVGRAAAVRRADVERAARWALGKASVGTLAWAPLPGVRPEEPESRVRRLLRAGAPMVVVRAGPRVVGVVDGAREAVQAPALSVAARLERPSGRPEDARLGLLRLAGRTGAALGVRVHAVGGAVRDLLLARPGLDVDLVVEGDGVAFARRLARETGGTVVAHPGFGTASVDGVSLPAGAPAGRIDVASSRREAYEEPGALPRVTPAALATDLWRRDYSVNAMALALAPGEFGRLTDPTGGQRDLERKRLRPLHPLSFVEDPTRIFRGARYAARLGLRMDRMGRAALRLALRRAPYRALSGQRLWAEIEAIAAEAHAASALGLLIRWRAFAIWDRAVRTNRQTATRVRAAWGLGRRASAAGVTVEPAALAVLALLLDQPRVVADRCLVRLAVAGGRRAALGAARAQARPLARALGAAGLPRSRVAAGLRGRPPLVCLGAWLVAGRRARRRIEWFLTEGRCVRALTTGDDLAGLGVPRGRWIGECLAALRDARLDSAVVTAADEQAFVRQWLARRPGVRQAAGRLEGRVT